MPQVVVPVRYPLSENSRATLAEAIQIADEEDADLTVLHVNLYQNSHRVDRTELKRAVEQSFGHVPRTRYVVRSGMLVEETILDEVAAQDADIVVIGSKQASRWRQMIRRLVDDPDVEQFLREELDCEIVTVEPDTPSSRHSSARSSGS
ncbi:universal stress protein UspA [Haloarcula hispanica N601]|uniref:Universal stress protein n=3 Tax=Haloarcula hispanica TaxID=51589 RepID=A0A482SZ30_HALHI|nr:MULTISPECIES: universal stress protein [Haloarcula]AEM56643.1 universal stress family protein [Haloarcula hispanica ATCC 33960]AHB65445.1 universal stress protein UspA [Haloarcula hispanica N601]AJF26572.1 universal stress protein UspA [Haloarcula sp. CBA1115]KAA9407604.1 universal stress protein [Haloarcula sp. CBA1131]KAA9409355.1 universal stress protein [Haloarcula hispanica]